MPNPSEKVVSIIPAAGLGVRMGLAVPKQYYEIDHKPLLIYTLEKFQFCHSVDKVVLVVPVEDVEETERMVTDLKITKVSRVVQGGEERQDSVREGLKMVPDHTEIVVIHDGVRPFVSSQKIEDCIEAAKEHGASILALPVKKDRKSVV